MQHVAARGVVIAFPTTPLNPLNLPVPDATRTATPAKADARHAAPLGAVWRNTVAAVVMQATPLLLLGVMGFVTTPLLGPVFAIFTIPLARVLMVQIAVHGNLRGIEWRRLLAALLMTWLYLATITAGQLAISVPLRSWGLNQNFADQPIRIWEQVAPALALRSVDALSAVSDSPLSIELRKLRNTAFAAWERQSRPDQTQEAMTAYWQNGPDAAGAGGLISLEKQAQVTGIHRIDLCWMILGGCLLVIAAEIVFAFRSIADLSTMQQIGLSLSHMGRVAGHLLLLKLMTVSLKVVFMFAPMLVVDCLAPLWDGWDWFGSPVQVQVLALCLALINAMAATFEAVYTSTLAQTLAGSHAQT